MRIRLLPLAALLVLTAIWPAAAEDKKPAGPAKKPTVIVRLAPIDSLVANASYLAKLAGKGDVAGQVEGMVKSMTNDKGLYGIDTTKPVGLYGYLTPGGYDSEAVLLLPIADEKTFQQGLETFGLKPEKGDDGVWKLEVERVPFPIFFKFANKYVYGTVRDAGVLAGKRLLDPATVLAGKGVASVVLNVDEIPKELKEIALSQSELQLSTAKDKEMPNETAAQKGFRTALLDETYSWLKALLYDGGAVSVQFDIDRKAGELTAHASLAGKPDSKLAETIAGLGKLTSVAAGIQAKDAAISLQVDAALPAKLREALGPVIEEAFKQVLEKEQDEAKRKLAEPIMKVITPTAKMGELDARLNVTGPDASGLFTFVAAAKIKDGRALDKAFQEGLKESPAKTQGSLSIDFAKVGDIGIHKAVPDKVDEHTRKTLGDNPVYFAFRDDTLLVSGGAKGLEAIKEVVNASPAAGKILQLDVAVARIASRMADEHKEAPAIAKRTFKGDDDTLRITLEGGETLKLSLNMKAQLVKFFAELGEATKEK
jgi:hypothetical protein